MFCVFVGAHPCGRLACLGGMPEIVYRGGLQQTPSLTHPHKGVGFFRDNKTHSVETIIVTSQDTNQPDVRLFAIPENAPVVWLFDVDQALKTHPAYVNAKAGDWQSALTLVSDLALAGVYANRHKFARD